MFFTTTDPSWDLKGPVHPNIFDISRTGIPNKQIMPAVLGPLDADSIIFFHMPITTPESYREQLPAEFQSRFKSITFEFAEAQNPAKINAKIDPVLSKLKKMTFYFLTPYNR